LPEITYLKPEALRILKEASRQGTNLIATNRALFDSPETLATLFGAKIEKKDNDGAGNYLVPDDRSIFRSFKGQSMLFWKFNLGLYDLSGADRKLLPVLASGRPGPPEIIGGHDPTGYYALAIKNHPNSKAALFPINLGKIYYMHGYQEHKNLLLDMIHHMLPEIAQNFQTNAPARVETVLKEFTKNTPENRAKNTTDGQILHLINLTGFSGNTYFEPLPVNDLRFRIMLAKKPQKVFTLTNHKPLNFTWKDGMISVSLTRLADFESIVMEW
jgi:hypothetical protein